MPPPLAAPVPNAPTRGEIALLAALGANKRHLEAAADAVPVDRRDHQLGRALEPQQRLVGVQAEEVLEAGRDGVQHPDVGAGREETVSLSPQDDDVHVVVEPGLQDRLVELAAQDGCHLNNPVAVTPDELGAAWRDGKVHLPLVSHLNGELFGQPDAGTDMTFNFDTLIAHVAKTRDLEAGSIVGSGTVSNKENGGPGRAAAAGGVDAVLKDLDFGSRNPGRPGLRWRMALIRPTTC